MDPCEPYRRLRTTYWRTWLFAGAAMLVAALGFQLPWEPAKGTIVTFALLVFAFFWFRAVVVWFQLAGWPCPRCGRSFLWSWWNTWPTNHCKHCGLSAEPPSRASVEP